MISIPRRDRRQVLFLLLFLLISLLLLLLISFPLFFFEIALYCIRVQLRCMHALSGNCAPTALEAPRFYHECLPRPQRFVLSSTPLSVATKFQFTCRSSYTTIHDLRSIPKKKNWTTLRRFSSVLEISVAKCNSLSGTVRLTNARPRVLPSSCR